MRRLSVVCALCATVLVTACGQKGPLTLPDKTAAVLTTPPDGAPAAAPASLPPPTPADKSKAKSAKSQPQQ